jgi:hypothetical protein
MPSSKEIQMVTRAHREGRAAYRKGLYQKRDNPYDGRAAKDSDEWLKHHSWHNGWNLQWIIDSRKKERAK